MHFFRLLGWALLATGVACPLSANVLIGGTRVVFPAGDGEITVRLTNDNTLPALVQAWVDRGDIHSTPEKSDAPFLITPPMFRMEPNKQQSLRIVDTRESRPADRESLFWLNVLEIPPKPKGPEFEGKNTLQFALRSRLKLFYRPEALKGDPLQAPSQLSYQATLENGECVLILHNPTPYHISFNDVKVSVDGKHYETASDMVKPLSDLRVPVKDLKKLPTAGTVIHLDAINDFGANTPFEAKLEP